MEIHEIFWGQNIGILFTFHSNNIASLCSCRVTACSQNPKKPAR